MLPLLNQFIWVLLLLEKFSQNQTNMQLLDSRQIQVSNLSNKQLLEVLKDIVNKVKIQSDFSIHHPDYKPLKIPVEAVERFKKLPEKMQRKYLSLNLQSFLYGIYYNGSMQATLTPEKDSNPLLLDLENKTLLGVDMGFYQRLHESNSGEGYFDPGWLVIKEESDDILAVIKWGLRLYIKREKHLQISEKNKGLGDSVAIYMPKNLVQNGFYVAVGNMGSNHYQDSENQSVTVRTYFNLTPEGAVLIMGSLTHQLNELDIPFSFKVLYNPKDYQRYDSGVLYFEKRDYEVVNQVLQIVYKNMRLHFKTDIPLFTKQLALGLGLAEEPDQKFNEQESFGMNRCQMVANGLLSAWFQGDNSSEGRLKAIFEYFFRRGIDLQHIYLNANSEDIYSCLDICN